MQAFGSKTNYPENTTVVVTETPGFWFQEFSGKNVIAQTDPTVQRNEIAESVLSLSYEIENPQTLIRAYAAKGDISDENYVSMDQVWNRVSYIFGKRRLSLVHSKRKRLQACRSQV